MISHLYNCIFIHIPKCAGTSIESAFGHLDGHVGLDGQDHRSIRMIEKPSLTRDILSNRDNVCEFFRGIKHQYASTVKNSRNKLTVTQQQYDSYFKFTIVRNPWDRAYSWYKNVLRDDRHRSRYGISRDMPFSDFLVAYIGTDMLKPQTYWLKNYAGDIDLDYIGKFETLAEDFREITKKMGVTHIRLPHKVRGSQNSYREIYDQTSIKLVRDYYAEEIALFGYDFDAVISPPSTSSAAPQSPARRAVGDTNHPGSTAQHGCPSR